MRALVHPMAAGTLHHMEPGQERNVLTQLRRGTVEFCVLALLRDGEQYGFELCARCRR